MRRSHSWTKLLQATALTSLTVVPAFAQEDIDNFTRLDRVVLGAGSEGVSIEKPQAITVLNQEDIDAEQATTVGELFDTVPGVQAIGSGRFAGQSFNIRGVGGLAASDESRIIVTLDGALKFHEQYRVGSVFLDPALLKRVEVLRGPASSTLYGSGALGGVINFETKDPSDFFTDGSESVLRSQLKYTSNGDEIAGSLTWANAVSERFETLVSLNHRDAREDYVAGGDVKIAGSEFDSQSVLLKAKSYFGDDLEQSLTFGYVWLNSDADDTELSQTNSSVTFGTVDRDVTDKTVTLRYENPAEANPYLDLDVLLSYSETEVLQENASLKGAFRNSALFHDAVYGYETMALKVENTFELSNSAFESFVTAGVQLSQQERVADRTEGVINFHPEGTDSKVGLYVQGELVFDSGLTVIPGLRADFVSLEAGEGVDGSDVDDTLFSPSIAAHYELTDTFSVFGSVARTERTPTLDEIYSFTPPGVDRTGQLTAGEPYSFDLKPESGQTLELGVSMSQNDVFQQDDALQMKVTAFRTQTDDLIARDSTEGTPYYENIDSATTQGVELEAAYESDHVFATLAYANIDGEDDNTGERLDTIPAQSLNLRVGGRLPETGVEYGWNGHFVNAISYSSDAEDQFDAYTVHDLFASYTAQDGPFDGIELRVAVENILDETYQNSLSGDDGAGRSYNVTLARSFEF